MLIPRKFIKTVKIFLDLTVLAGAYYLAFVIRFEGAIPARYVDVFVSTLPFILLVHYGSFMVFRVPNLSWRFVSVLEARRISAALVISSALLILWCSQTAWSGLTFPAVETPPRGVLLIAWSLSLLGVLGLRVAFRLGGERWERRQRRAGKQPVPTLLIGAGVAGAAVAEEVRRHPELGIEALGFLDDDPTKTGTVIHGIPVLGRVAELPGLAQSQGARQTLITLGDPCGETIRRILAQCKKGGLPAKIVPGMSAILEGKINLGAIREVAIEDLLRRDPVHLDLQAVAGFLHSRRIVITGAGGSIGSQLCRTVCRFGPASLVLVEHAENNLFHIHRELGQAYPRIPLIPCVADIGDYGRMRQIFAAYQPDMVLHAAAHKHVPMMEWNPAAAIKNNVLGTRIIADLAHECQVGEFVMISTDKAVNPTSVMGVSKRIAEIYIQALSQRSPTRFVTVRFGNVLGSAGSVMPIFQEQIAQGGPVTITHPDMKRYFMTIPEACQLVLQAASMGQGGEIFILDMGEPVKIVDLARDLIHLSGLSLDEIEICFTGIRPGEKLFEELALADEIACKTKHPKIFIGRLQPCDWEEIGRHLDQLQQLAQGADVRAIFGKIREIVPEYEPVDDELGLCLRSDPEQLLTGPSGNGREQATGRGRTLAVGGGLGLNGDSTHGVAGNGVHGINGNEPPKLPLPGGESRREKLSESL